GRIVHLQPVRWQDGWPVMGEVLPGSSIGEPVAEYPELPVNAGAKASALRPQTSDEFHAQTLGPQWEWNHNPDGTRWSLIGQRGFLRLVPGEASDFLHARNSLTQQMQSESLDFTVRMDVSHMENNIRAGLAMLDKRPSGLEVVQQAGKRRLQFLNVSESTDGPELQANTVQLRVHVDGDPALYSYSLDEARSFPQLGVEAPVTFSFWKGSRPALFAYKATAPSQAASQAPADSGREGWIDFDWAHYRTLP